MHRAILVGVLAVLAACGDDASDEAAVLSSPSATATSIGGSVTATVSLEPLPPNGECGPPRERELDVSMHAVTDAMGIFRRRQHADDAVAEHEVQGLPADDMDLGSTRAASGIGGRFILVPTHTVKQRCDEDPAVQGPSGVCVVAAHAPKPASRCFDMAAVRAGRAVALTDTGRVAGLAPDGVDAVVIDVGGERTETAVVENAYLASVPGASPGTEARITLVRESLDGCEPPAAMREAAPTLDHPPNPGGVPAVIRRSVSYGFDSRIAAKYARIWGGGDGLTYWIVPRLRCEVASLHTDSVCVVPVKESYHEASSGCVKPGETGWIHFPDGDVSAIAGFAPAHAREAVVRVDGGTVVLPVDDRVFAGRLEGIPLEAEVGVARVEFR